MDSKETKWGFPKGKVASTLKNILSKEFTNKDIDTIAVVLMLRSMVELSIERVLFLMLNYEYPHYGKGMNPKETQKYKILNEKMEDELWKVIVGMNFHVKLSLIEPCLKVWYPGFEKTIKEINRVRNKIAHLNKLKSLKFKNKLIWSEEGIEEFFVTAQITTKEINKFCERIEERNEAIKDTLREMHLRRQTS
jgi:hypothetical protein